MPKASGKQQPRQSKTDSRSAPRAKQNRGSSVDGHLKHPSVSPPGGLFKNSPSSHGRMSSNTFLPLRHWRWPSKHVFLCLNGLHSKAYGSLGLTCEATSEFVKALRV